LFAGRAGKSPFELELKVRPRGIACDAAEEVDRLCGATTPSDVTGFTASPREGMRSRR